MFVAVIVLPGTGCIDAYLMTPVWDSYGVAYRAASEPVVVALLFTTRAPAKSVTESGPLVPDTEARA